MYESLLADFDLLRKGTARFRRVVLFCLSWTLSVIDENNIPHGRFQPFTFTLTAELGRDAPFPPPDGEYEIPWASVEEFRRRAAKLKEALHELQPQAQAEENVRRGPMDCLTEQERLFIAGYQYEMTGREDGPATVGWLVEHNLSHADMHLFTMQLTMELDAEGLPYPPRPAEYPVPWSSLEEFRARSVELREKQSEARSQAGVDKNTHQCSTEEPDETER